MMCLSKKEAEEQKTAGRAELDLEKLKVGLGKISAFLSTCRYAIHQQFSVWVCFKVVEGEERQKQIHTSVNVLMQRQELESENKKLKQNLNELRKSLTNESSDVMPPAPGSLPYNILLDQLSSSNEELEMRKEEVLLLRSHMVRQEALKHKVMT